MAEMRVMNRAVRWLWIPVLALLAWSGWVVYERRASVREAEETAERRRLAQDREIVDKLGAGKVTIHAFYANPAVVASGGRQTRLCYSVANANRVWVEPAVADVWPSLSRCAPAKVEKDTEFTLRAEGRDGTVVESSVKVTVER